MAMRMGHPSVHDAAVAVLLAGDVQARAVHNASGNSVVIVQLVDGGEVVWGNAYLTPGGELVPKPWSATLVDPGGNQYGLTTDVPADASPEEVARTIATFEYPAPVVFPTAVDEVD